MPTPTQGKAQRVDHHCRRSGGPRLGGAHGLRQADTMRDAHAELHASGGEQGPGLGAGAVRGGLCAPSLWVVVGPGSAPARRGRRLACSLWSFLGAERSCRCSQ